MNKLIFVKKIKCNRANIYLSHDINECFVGFSITSRYSMYEHTISIGIIHFRIDICINFKRYEHI